MYREGNYAEALKEYEEAEPLVPHLPQLWRGKGLACRQMIAPGAKTPENTRAIDCALAAFDRLRQLRTADGAGELLYVQTLFDADRFETLASFYQERLRSNPSDPAALNGLIQTYSRWNRMDEAIAAYEKRAALHPTDAEAQYAVGVYIWQQLFLRGGGPDKASYDPRVDPEAAAAAAASAGKGKAKGHKGKGKGKGKGTTRGKREAAPPPPVKQPPPFALGDVVGAQRITLADLGIKYLEKALALRPKYREALIYMNLLYRQKSLAYFNDPNEWQACVDAAEKWRARAEAEGAKDSPKDPTKDPVKEGPKDAAKEPSPGARNGAGGNAVNDAPKGGPGPR
ncbi:MAG TPA: hypothetical protein VIU64_12815 [Polyangia bacterium]